MNKFAKKVYPALLSVVALSSFALAKPTHASAINRLGKAQKTVKVVKANNLRHRKISHNKNIILPKKQIKNQRINHKHAKRVFKIHKHSNWYADGLSKSEQRCRAKIVYMESRGQWRATNGYCWGRFQLKTAYLMHHGHLDLDHKFQVKKADHYVAHRYGSWHNALLAHYRKGWY